MKICDIQWLWYVSWIGRNQHKSSWFHIFSNVYDDVTNNAHIDVTIFLFLYAKVCDIQKLEHISWDCDRLY